MDAPLTSFAARWTAALGFSLLAAAAPAAAADSPLVDAVKRGDRTAIRTLAKQGAVDAPAPDGSTALHWAVRAGDLDTVELLLRAGASATTVSRYGATPLALAAAGGNVAIVERLLAAGATATSSSAERESVLASAARTGNAAIVKTLLAHGADPNVREGWLGQTALMWAAANNHGAVTAMLLEAGADPYVASRIFRQHDLRPGDAGTPKSSQTSKGGLTALHYAAREGAVQAVRALADHGVDLDQADPDGMTPLIYATINGHTESAALLLERGANPNLADTYGRTVLYAAIDVHRMEAVAPRPAPSMDEAVTPMQLVKLAIAKGAALNPQITGPLPPRSTQGNNDTTPVGATPLWRAAKSSDVEMVRILLDAGADPSIPARDGVTPLMVAAGQDWKFEWSLGTEDESIETIKALIGAGEDLERRNARQETALHGAADRGANAVVRFLVEQGARLDARDRSNRTPLDIALGVAPTTGRNPFEDRARWGSDATAALLRELMTARGMAIEPYVKPGEAKPAAAQQ